MKIKCVFFGSIREVAGTKTTTQIVGEDTTVTELIEELTTEYDGLEKELLTNRGELRDSLVLTVNKRHVDYLDGESTELSEDDTVRITTSIQGG